MEDKSVLLASQALGWKFSLKSEIAFAFWFSKIRLDVSTPSRDGNGHYLSWTRSDNLGRNGRNSCHLLLDLKMSTVSTMTTSLIRDQQTQLDDLEIFQRVIHEMGVIMVSGVFRKTIFYRPKQVKPWTNLKNNWIKSSITEFCRMVGHGLVRLQPFNWNKKATQVSYSTEN